MILGIPLSLVGVLFYASLFVLALLFLTTGKRLYINTISVIVLVGFLASIRFVYVQIVVLNSICEFCMVSALLSALLFGSVAVKFYSDKRARMRGSKEEAITTSSYE